MTNCKAAWKEIEELRSHIFWSPYVAHTLNLIFKDFAHAFPWISKTYQKGKPIVKYSWIIKRLIPLLKYWVVDLYINTWWVILLILCGFKKEWNSLCVVCKLMLDIQGFVGLSPRVCLLKWGHGVIMWQIVTG